VVVPPALSTEAAFFSAVAPARATDAAGAADESFFAVAGSGMLLGGAKAILSVPFFKAAGIESAASPGFAAGGAV
jgi:hypothetical protein